MLRTAFPLLIIVTDLLLDVQIWTSPYNSGPAGAMLTFGAGIGLPSPLTLKVTDSSPGELETNGDTAVLWNIKLKGREAYFKRALLSEIQFSYRRNKCLDLRAY